MLVEVEDRLRVFGLGEVEGSLAQTANRNATRIGNGDIYDDEPRRGVKDRDVVLRL